jgi:hypothetical protein
MQLPVDKKPNRLGGGATGNYVTMTLSKTKGVLL